MKLRIILSAIGVICFIGLADNGCAKGNSNKVDGAVIDTLTCSTKNYSKIIDTYYYKSEVSSFSYMTQAPSLSISKE